MTKATTTTPDPELSLPVTDDAVRESVLGGGDPARGEVAGCPTGLAPPAQVVPTQQPGGGGAPGTGRAEPDDKAPSGEPA